MIFVTVGTQLPFPRLLSAMNDLAGQINEYIIAQTGQGDQGWANMTCHATMTPDQFQSVTRSARIIVSHAGIGTILTAKSLGLPLIIMPRRHALGEHRNDHQLATARYVEQLQGIHVAWEADDLAPLLNAPQLDAATSEPGPSHAALVDRIRAFIDL